MSRNAISLRLNILAAIASTGLLGALLGNTSCGGQSQGGSGDASSSSASSASSSSASTGSGGTNCSEGGVGVCCDYHECYTTEEMQKWLLPGAGGAGGAGGGAMGGAGGMGGTGGMGGMGGAPSACPTLDKLNTQIEVCSFITNGPTEENGLCCYTVYSGNCCGRPFLVAGQAELAPVAQRDDWLHVTPSIDAMGEATRRALAAAWLEDARMEHASIASFARFTMHLLALGAPASLVEAAQRAGLDEVAHARACFGLAARYAGEPLGPARLPVEGALVGTTLRDAAVAAVVEGCIGETTAAFVAAEQCSVAQDEAAREALVRIAQDEAAHAELAWRFVAWALREGGEEVRRAVREAFVRSLQTPDEVTLPLAEGVDALAFRAHGRLLPEEAARARRDARSKIIAPSASRLLEVCPVTVVQAFI